MRESIITIEGYLHFLDYHISHQQLLLRHSYIVDAKYRNTDILFEGVFYLQTVPSYSEEGSEILKGDDNDKGCIAPFVQKDFKWLGRNVYVIKTKEGSEYFICAAIIHIAANDLPIGKTSIVMAKE